MTDVPADESGLDLDAPENSWIMLRTAVNRVMLETLDRVGDADREKVTELRDSVGQKMAAEFLRVHPNPAELVAQMFEAGAIRINFDDA